MDTPTPGRIVLVNHFGRIVPAIVTSDEPGEGVISVTAFPVGSTPVPMNEVAHADFERVKGQHGLWTWPPQR